MTLPLTLPLTLLTHGLPVYVKEAEALAQRKAMAIKAREVLEEQIAERQVGASGSVPGSQASEGCRVLAWLAPACAGAVLLQHMPSPAAHSIPAAAHAIPGLAPFAPDPGRKRGMMRAGRKRHDA